MPVETKIVRQSVSLPAKTATQVRSVAKSRRVSTARILSHLIENGIDAQKRKQQEFFDLAQRSRNDTDPPSAINSADSSLAADAENRALGQLS